MVFKQQYCICKLPQKSVNFPQEIGSKFINKLPQKLQMLDDLTKLKKS